MAKNLQEGIPTMELEITKTLRVLALGFKHRDAGQMISPTTKELITWSEATLLKYLPLGLTDGEIRKSPIAPDALAKVQLALIDAHWGAVVDLTIENRQIIDIEVMMDPMAAYCG